uniref:G_PROTEIN_RECEP_F1_2 domain-containing protein n=1 Tax=Steinernema glaseri TaxID=37863 RepID=A0A1I8A3S4_9BILA
FVYRVTIGKAYYQLEYDTFRLRQTTGFAAMIKHITRRSTRTLVLLKSTDTTVLAQAIITLCHASVVKCGNGRLFVSLLSNRATNIVFIAWSEVMTLINPISYLLLVRYADRTVDEAYEGVVFQKSAPEFHERRSTRTVALLKSTDTTVLAQAIITLCHASVVKCGNGRLFTNLLSNRATNIVFIAWSEVMTLINPISYLLLVRYVDRTVDEGTPKARDREEEDQSREHELPPEFSAFFHFAKPTQDPCSVTHVRCTLRSTGAA